MSLFRNQKKRQSKNSESQRASRSHHAVWGSNGVTFFSGVAGVSWSYDSSIGYMDDVFAKAALCQLERAYHLKISFPHSEEMVLKIGRMQHPDVSEPIVPFFDWKPPLPRS
jgi:hypothetical protein